MIQKMGVFGRRCTIVRKLKTWHSSWRRHFGKASANPWNKICYHEKLPSQLLVFWFECDEHSAPRCDLSLQDNICLASKTDVDHGLGYLFNNLWVKWRAHHSVNSWFHHTRTSCGDWLHPYATMKYGKTQEKRRLPPFFDKVPITLTMKYYSD